MADFLESYKGEVRGWREEGSYAYIGGWWDWDLWFGEVDVARPSIDAPFDDETENKEKKEDEIDENGQIGWRGSWQFVDAWWLLHDDLVGWEDEYDIAC